MLFRELCGGLLAVAGKLPRASGSRRFSNRNWRWRLPITLLRHCGIADVLPAQCLRALQTCLSDHGAPFFLEPGSLGRFGRVLMTRLSPQYVFLMGRFLICFERKEGCFLPSKVFNSQEPYSVKATKIFSMSFVDYQKRCYNRP